MKRVHWNEDQIESLAAAFVRLRCLHPFTAYGILMDKAQDECFTEENKRPLPTVNLEPRLKDRIVSLYAKTTHAEPPPPSIIEIPVEKSVDYVELANRLDAPTLMMLLTKRLTETLGQLRFANGVETQHSATAKAAPLSLLLAASPPPQPRPPRVAFCCADNSLFNKLRTEVENQKIEVELRFVDIEHRPPQIPTSADFVVFPKKAAGGVAWETARAVWGKSSRVFIVENNVESAVQKMRDIVSLKVRLPNVTSTPARAAA